MPLFCGTKCKCKKNCKAWFPTNKDGRKGCEAACKGGNPPTSRNDYLNRFAGQDIALRDFGIDTDPDDNFDPCSLPENMYRAECQPEHAAESSGPSLLIISAIVIALLFVLFFRKK